MNAAVFQAVPAAARPLTEKDPGCTATGTAPVAATPVLAAAVFAAGFVAGVAVCDAIGDTSPVEQ
ncbi:hypothetical protein [Streptomyces sp. NBC_00059]|uniref:hypothetical protein n=1 Tax=Streptomyces sp. NBC_00059 TaxID=2975635 RepID=UPI0022554FA4|nr:hypothetical protein [Streptomyces sp. NBC_00059]MCX5414294.1 hypothetical protein [Streptomyces sp. NBC_00059]